MQANSVKNKDFSVIIPAAGLSQRMKEPKAFLKHLYAPTFLEHLTNVYLKNGCLAVVVVVNKFIYKKAEQILGNTENCFLTLNDNISEGRFYSLKQGLLKLPVYSHCFIQNIDNPCINDTLIKDMLTLIDDDSYVVPVFNNQRGHPLLIGSNVVKDFTEEKHKTKHIREYLENYPEITYQTKDEGILLNINTKRDYLNYHS